MGDLRPTKTREELEAEGRVYLTDEEVEQYELEPGDYWYDRRGNVHRHEDSAMVKVLVPFNKHGPRQKKKADDDLESAQLLVLEELGLEWDDATERERTMAMQFIDGSSADRKMWFEYVRKVRGSETGQTTLPLALDEGTQAALIKSMEVIVRLQRERYEQRLAFLHETRNS